MLVVDVDLLFVELLEKMNELEKRLKEANKKNSRLPTKLPSQSSDTSDDEGLSHDHLCPGYK